MSDTDRVEVNPEETNNISLEQEAKQQEAEVNKPTETKEERPSWLPEKFSNAEELAKAYSALERKQSQPEEPAQQEAQQVAEDSQVNSLEKYYSEYAENGVISDKSYEELGQMGLGRDLVDGYIEGQKAIVDNDVQQVHDVVGGQENYQKIIDFAQNNLSDAEVNAFNETLDYGSIEQVKFAVQAIASRANVSASSEPQEMLQGDTETASVDAFQSVAQVVEAMNDKRYSSDPAYRKEVETKIAKSSVL